MSSAAVMKIDSKKIYKKWQKKIEEEIDKFILHIQKDKKFAFLRQNGKLSYDEIKKMEFELNKIASKWTREKIKDFTSVGKANAIAFSVIHEIKLKMSEFENKLEEKQTKLDTKTEIKIDDEIKNYIFSLKEEKIDKNYNQKEKKDFNELLFYLQKLKELDKNEYTHYFSLFKSITDPSHPKAEILYHELKSKYYTLKKTKLKTKYYKNVINSILPDLDDVSLIEEAKALLEKKDINYVEFNNFYKKSTEKIENKKYAQKLALKMKGLLNEYDIIDINENFIKDLTSHKLIKLPFKKGEYEVYIRLNDNNEILTRFVKTISDEQISTSEKLTDKTNLKKWCEIQKEFFEKLKKDFDYNLNILEDENTEIVYVYEKSEKNQMTKRRQNEQNS